ncbi:hypothetical protein 20Sep420_00020 [Pseudomonas phage 20Sep420]|nr:hypothetical protein 20Sep420_00020 [Pseudomonas phage 20Sep420]
MCAFISRGLFVSEQITANFSVKELTVTNRNEPNVPNATELANLRQLAIHILQPLRDSIGLPIIINSAFRSEKVNEAVGGSKTSQHRLGQAADIRVKGMTSQEVCEAIIRLGLPFDQLIEEFGSWTHVSFGPRNRRQVLHARKIGGKTKYLPGLEQ